MIIELPRPVCHKLLEQLPTDDLLSFRRYASTRVKATLSIRTEGDSDNHLYANVSFPRQDDEPLVEQVC